jgi:hypothetical protein
MNEQYRRLMQGFVAARPEDPAPDDLLESLRGLPEVGQLPPLWVPWTLVQLVGRLQYLSMTPMSERESAEAWWREKETDAARLDRGYPLLKIDGDDERELHTGYGYFFHYISVDSSYPESLDPCNYWMTSRLPFVFVPEFLGRNEFIYYIDGSNGRRIGSDTGYIEPSTATAELGVAELEAAGLVERVLIREGSFGHSLTPAALEHAASIAAFSDRWRQVTGEKQVWLAAAIGDWPAAHAAALRIERRDNTPCPELIAFTRERAGRCRARRDADPRARGQVCDIATAVLRGRYPSDTRQFSEEFWEAIRSAPPPPDREIRTDEGGDDVPWPPGVRQLLDHALPLGRLPRDWIEQCCYGETPGQKREIIRVFARDETMLATAAFRAFSDAPEQALTLVRRGLRSPSVRSRIYTAALLGAIDEPWSRQELWQAFQEPADPHETVQLRAALRYSEDQDAVQALKAWEQAHGLPYVSIYDLPGEEWRARERVDRYKVAIRHSTYSHRFRRISNRE